MLKNYLRIALRAFRRNRSYTLLNVLGLSLSITCGILIFTLVNYHLGFDNFHNDADRIYRFVTEQKREDISYVPSVPPALGKVFRDDYPFAEKLARVVTFDDELVTVPDEKDPKKFIEKTGIAFAEPDFLQIFNFPLVKGNAATVISDLNTAVISERIAHKYFGDQDPINRIIRINNRADLRVTGVLKDLPANTDFKPEIYISWLTLRNIDGWLSGDDSWGGISSSLQCYVKLNRNVSSSRVEALLPAYVKKYRPDSRNIHRYLLQPMSQVHFDPRFDGPMEKKNLWILSSIAVFLIITACVNFINLATAQALRRSKEVGIRKVLGGHRLHLFWQFISETAVITIVATLFAIGLSYLLVPYVNSWFHTNMSIHFLSNLRLQLFTVMLVVLVTFLAGAYPGLILSGFSPIAALKGRLSMQQVSGFNTRRSLIVAQFAISLVLIICMIVVTRQMHFSNNADMGFDKEAIVMIPMGADSIDQQGRTLARELADVPGVQSVSLCFTAPSSRSNWFGSVRFDSRTEEEDYKVNIRSADDQYVKTFGLQLVAGRNIYPSDTAREFLINETLLTRLHVRSVDEALGRTLYFNGSQKGTIVGVLKNFHDLSFHGDINAVAITSYPDTYQNYAVRLDLSRLSTALPALEKKWSSTFPDKIFESTFVSQRIAEFYETESNMLKLINTFSFIAIFISCLGLYGLVMFMVAQRTREIGIRKVLGGGVGGILLIFGKEFGKLVAIAFLVATPIAWWLMTNWLQDFKFHIMMTPMIFVLAVLLVAGLAALTVGYQSVKAALVNPIRSLRSE